MTENTRRVVAGFEDPHEADAAAARLQAERPGADVERNSPADEHVAFDSDERGDSAERPPAVTVAVEVPADEVDEGVAELVADGEDVEHVEVESPR
jgi:hypothetical protein